MRKSLNIWRSESILICADTLRNDDFHGSFEARKELLLKEIEKAMGNPIIREDEN